MPCTANLGLRALEDVLDAQVIALMSTAEIDAEGRLVPQNLAEPRLATPGSGLYAEILGSRGSWRSPSAIGSGLNLAAEPLPGRAALRARAARGRHAGARAFARHPLGVGGGRAAGLRHSRGRRASSPGTGELLRVRAGLVTGSIAALAAPARRPRGGAADLARAAAAPRAARSSRSRPAAARSLGTGWPRELAGVTGNLNAFLVGERKRTERYRTTLGNLAHSLKTPLAALRSLVDSGETGRDALVPQLERMQDIVQHQLKRAVLGGSARR